MRGEHTVVVSNRRRVKYELKLRRNITVIRGDSGTGKTTLYQMIVSHTRSQDVGVTVQCDKRCMALTDLNWRRQIEETDDSIVFIDEGAPFLGDHDFAVAIKGTSNYYVIFTRESLHQLPYSIDEIYEIKASGKFHTLIPLYKETPHHIYGKRLGSKEPCFQMLLAEDSKAGFQLYDFYFKEAGIACESAGSKSKLMSFLLEHKSENVFVIADGAAFGDEAGRIMKYQQEHADKVTVCLPESFEWLVLSSGLIKGGEVSAVLANPSEYIDSEKYESWEQFFAAFLKEVSRGTPFAYDKGRLREAYATRENGAHIIALVACGNIR